MPSRRRGGAPGANSLRLRTVALPGPRHSQRELSASESDTGIARNHRRDERDRLGDVPGLDGNQAGDGAGFLSLGGATHPLAALGPRETERSRAAVVARKQASEPIS